MKTNNEIYTTLKGGRKVILNGLKIKWSDAYGKHTGEVIAFGRTCDQGGSPITHEKIVYRVKCDNGEVCELRRCELNEIIEGLCK